VNHILQCLWEGFKILGAILGISSAIVWFLIVTKVIGLCIVVAIVFSVIAYEIGQDILEQRERGRRYEN